MNHPIYEKAKLYLQEIVEMGMFEKIVSTHSMRSEWRCLAHYLNDLSIDGKLWHDFDTGYMSPIFVISVVGFLASLVCFVSELVKHKRNLKETVQEL